MGETATSPRQTVNNSQRLRKKPILLLNWWPVLVVIIVWLIFSHPYWIKGLVPFPSRYLVTFFPPWINYYGMSVKNAAMPDVVSQLYPWKHITIESYRAGQLPGWNPYQFAGTPHLGNYQSAVFSPMNIVFFILPAVTAWSIVILLQPLLAGIFMYLYMRSIDVGRIGSIIGSIAFAFCGYMVVWMAYGTLGYALLCLPLLLYAIESYLHTLKKRYLVLIVISLAFSLYSGHFQTSFYIIVTALLYIGYRIIQERKRQLFKSLLISFSVGIILASPQLIPTISLYQQSTRSSSFESGKSLPLQYLITTIAPDFFGNPVTRNDWIGYYAERISYAGVIPLILAFFSLIVVRKHPAQRFFVVLAFVSFLIAYNKHIGFWLSRAHIPVLSTTNNSRILSLVSFSIAALSGIAYEQLRQKGNLILGTFIRMSIGIIAFITVLWIMLITHLFPWPQETTIESITIAIRNSIFPTILIVVGIIGVFSLQQQNRIIRTGTTIVLICLVMTEMLRFSMKWMPFDEKHYMYPTLQVLSFLQTHVGVYRVYGNFGNEGQSMFELYGIEGYDPLYIKRYGEFIQSVQTGRREEPYRSGVVFPKQGRYAKRALDLLGVRYLLHSVQDKHNTWVFPFWKYPASFSEPIFSDGVYEVYENRGVLPRAYLVDSYMVIKNDQALLDRLFAPETDLRTQVMLEEYPEAELDLCAERIKPSETVSIDNYSANSIQIVVHSSCEAFLFLSDVYYPGWSVYVNDQKKPIQRANYAFRAVVVPQGDSVVRFVYENWYR